MCYQVMIVEDDPMVAAINKKYTETVPGFRVAGVFRNGAEGLEYLRSNHVDLVILDYYMPEMNGDVFMDRIREEGIQVSVIMVTSANSADTVRSLLLKGVRDYLVKPFELERFQAALERFRSTKELLTGAGSGMAQSELDRLFAGNAGSTVERNESLELPKGLNDKTLQMVRSRMKENAGKKMDDQRGDRPDGGAFQDHSAALSRLSPGLRGTDQRDRLPHRRTSRDPVPLHLRSCNCSAPQTRDASHYKTYITSSLFTKNCLAFPNGLSSDHQERTECGKGNKRHRLKKKGEQHGNSNNQDRNV